MGSEMRDLLGRHRPMDYSPVARTVRSENIFGCLLPYFCFSWENRNSDRNRPKNSRVYFLLAALAIGGIVLFLREHRPSFLRPDLHLSA